jgi:lysyl-tRNA synthetase class 1
VKFSLQPTLPATVAELSLSQKSAMHKLAEQLQPGMNAEAIHQMVYALKDEFQLKPAEIFEAVYTALLGKKSGPRVGMFLAALDIPWVQRRLREI